MEAPHPRDSNFKLFLCFYMASGVLNKLACQQVRQPTSITKVRVGRGVRVASSLVWSVQLLMSAPVWRHTSRTDAPLGPASTHSYEKPNYGNFQFPGHTLAQNLSNCQRGEEKRMHAHYARTHQ